MEYGRIIRRMIPALRRYGTSNRPYISLLDRGTIWKRAQNRPHKDRPTMNNHVTSYGDVLLFRSHSLYVSITETAARMILTGPLSGDHEHLARLQLELAAVEHEWRDFKEHHTH